MGYIYVMSDIHGEFGLFKEMLNHIGFNKEDKLIILGDILDRGNNPISLLKYIIKHRNIELIMGNHEKMFLDYILAKDERERYFAYHSFVNNGGYTTLLEYDNLDNESQVEIVKYLEGLSRYRIYDKFILVHSGLNMSGLEDVNDISKIMEVQTEEDLLWSREEFYNEKGVDGYNIIFGHTPTTLIRKQERDCDFSIWYDNIYKDKIGIDCGATFGRLGGMLGCLRLNDMKEFYVKGD